MNQRSDGLSFAVVESGEISAKTEPQSSVPGYKPEWLNDRASARVQASAAVEKSSVFWDIMQLALVGS